MTRLNIFIENIYTKKNVEEKKILTIAKKILKFFLQNNEIVIQSCLKNYSYKSICLDIVLCDDAKIHEINREYRKIDRPTDVISFALFADSKEDERFIFDDEINLGEIIVSLDKTAQQAEEKGHSFDNELFFLISHGIMHLLGFDHKTEDELDFMLKQQEKSLESANVKIHP